MNFIKYSNQIQSHLYVVETRVDLLLFKRMRWNEIRTILYSVA